MSDNKAKRIIKVLEVGGTPYDMGFQYGAACPEISAVLDSMYQLFGGRDETKSIAGSYIPKYLPPAETFAPEIVEEMKGMAAGAKLDFEDIFFLNITYELAVPPVMGCTSFVVGPGATGSGEIYAGQNFDYLMGWQNDIVLLKMRPDRGPGILAVAPAGCLGLFGFNSAGISLNLNLLRNQASLAPDGGVPSHVILRKVLSGETLGQAIGTIASAERRSAKNYLMSSSQGDIVDVEVTADEIDVRYAEDGMITHGNHFVADRFKADDLAPLQFPDSYIRTQRLLHLMKRHRGNISAELLKQLLQDHNNYPNAVCRHPDPSNPLPIGRMMKTLVSIISCPEQQKAWIALGNPCENDYLEYSL